MKKRLISCLTVLMLIFTLVPATAFAYDWDDETVVTFGSATGKRGETVDVTVDLTKNSGVMVVKFDFTWDTENLVLIKVLTKGSVVPFETAPAPLYEGSTAPTDLDGYYNSSPFTLMAGSPTNVELDEDGEPTTIPANYEGTGKLVTLRFAVRDNAPNGTYNITVATDGDKEAEDTIDKDMKPVDVNFVAGVITIEGEEPHTHTMTLVPAKAATCEEDGNTDYYKCTGEGCDFWSQDETGANEITDHNSVIIPKLNHSWGTPEYKWEADGDGYKCTATCKCANDKDNKHPKTEEGTVTKKDVAETCETAGYTEYTATFSDSTFTKQTYKVNGKPAKGHDYSGTVEDGYLVYEWTTDHSSCKATLICKNDPTHTISETKASVKESTAPDCETAGETIYKVDFDDARFPDTEYKETGTAAGHDWEAPSYTWADDGSSCYAVRYCSRNHDHFEEETVTLADGTITEAIIAPTCEKAGQKVYTAKFTNTAFKADPKTVDGDPALEHDWNDPVYTWADDYSYCEATRTCKNDKNNDHSQYEKAMSSVVTDPATCETAGSKTYTVTFTNTAFKAEPKVVPIGALGHQFGAPTYVENEDHSVYAERVCSRNSDHKESETAVPEIKTVPVTCGTDGTTTYTYTFNNKEFSYGPIVVTDQKAEGHVWGETEYFLQEDGSLTAAHHCTKCQDGYEEENVAGVVTYDPAPTCEEGGKKITTYTFTKSEDFKTQTLEELVDPLNHDYYCDRYEWNDDRTICTAVIICRNDPGHGDMYAKEGVLADSKDPTDTEDGFKTYTAEFNGITVLGVALENQTITDTVPALGTVTYTVSDVTWKQGSTDGAQFVVNRSKDDDLTFSEFKSVAVDGTDVDAANYTAEAGSLKLTFSAAYLATLSEGEHTVKFTLEKGTAEAKLNVAKADEQKPEEKSEEKPTDNTPKTGAGAAAGAIALVIAAATAVVVKKKK
ncbi:MAG: hypothetical protein IKP47_00650 [Ruminococcus sp.]|nr:hypothetical protein [Ruminococcus sp.]